MSENKRAVLPERDGWRSYFVFVDGVGEYDLDWTYVVVRAQSPTRAIEIATAPEMGYGRDEDGNAFVVAAEHITAFRINESRRKIAIEASLEECVE